MSQKIQSMPTTEDYRDGWERTFQPRAELPTVPEKRCNARRFRTFEEADGVRIVESSQAFEGAHARIFCDEAPHEHVQVTVAQARAVIRGLERFIDEAEDDQLTEPSQRERSDADEL